MYEKSPTLPAPRRAGARRALTYPAPPERIAAPTQGGTVTVPRIRLALLVLVAAAVAVLAPLSAASGVFKARCGSKAGSYLFWPHGHHAIPRIGFPKFLTPHLELYGGLHRTSFPPNAEDAYIDATGSAAVARRCHATAAGFLFAPMRHVGSTTATHEIECNFHAPVTYRLGRTINGARLQTVLGVSTLVVDVRMSRRGSVIAFDKRYCVAMPPPS
jgi:hypothetical protein